jgi:hypothetical protein
MNVTGDARQVVAVLAWAQDAGLQLSQVTVGTCHVELHRSGSAVQPDGDSARREGIYGQFGGPALQHAVESEIPGNELQPAIGRHAR